MYRRILLSALVVTVVAVITNSALSIKCSFGKCGSSKQPSEPVPSQPETPSTSTKEETTTQSGEGTPPTSTTTLPTETSTTTEEGPNAPSDGSSTHQSTHSSPIDGHHDDSAIRQGRADELREGSVNRSTPEGFEDVPSGSAQSTWIPPDKSVIGSIAKAIRQAEAREQIAATSPSVVIPPPTSEITNANIVSSGTDADPVNTYTGELFDSYSPDLNLGGPMTLFFSRYYASGLKDAGVTGNMGGNWRHNFEWTMTLRGTKATIISNKGRNIIFTNNGASWDLIGKTDVPFQLVTRSSDFVLYGPGTERLYTFDSSGRLGKIEDGKGNAHTMAYSGPTLTQVSDGLGRTLTFVYDGNDKLSAVSDGTRTVTFGYTGNDLSRVTDARAKITNYTYNTGGLMTAKTRPAGNTPYSQTYDIDNKVSRQTDALGNTHTFTYNTSDTTMTDPLGNTSKHTHSINGELTANRRQDGKSTSVGYDSDGRRSSVTDLLGDTTSYIYHTASGRIASVTNTDGTITTYTYTARTHSSGIVFYDLTTLAYPDTTKETFVYDTSGNITSHTDRGGNVWTMTFNSRGQALTAANPSSGVTIFTYNADSTLATTKDASNNTTTYTYDSLKRLVTIIRSDAATSTFTYDNNDNVLTATDERGNTTTFTYDDNNNLATITDRLRNTTTFAYDGMDRVSSVTDPLANASGLTYDEIERLKTVTDCNENTATLGYDKRGRLTSITDSTNKIWARTYDAESIVTSSTNPLSNTICFTSDKMGRIKKTTSPLGSATNIVYDSMGRVTAIQDPLLQTTTNSYDTRGLLSGISLPGGISATYTRNALGRITNVTDPNGNAWQRAYDAQGRQTSRTDPLGNATSYTYDNRNRVSRANLPASTLDYTYDGADNITRKLYSDATDLAYTYDNEGRLTGANGLTLTYDDNGRITNSNGLIVARDAGGRMATLTLTTGKTVTYAYDSRNLLTGVTDWLGGTTTFTYDDAGQLTGIIRPNGVNTAYTYDNDSYLAGVQHGALSNINLTRDANGQITAANRSLPLEPTLTDSAAAYSYDVSSQISSFRYDALGRLTADGTRVYNWDLASRLTSYTEGNNTVSFMYDALGNRVSRTVDGVTRSYIWNYSLGIPSITVEMLGGSLLRYYIHTQEGTLLYSIKADDNSRRDYHYDEMGNTLFITDSSGVITASYVYGPYGTLLASTGTVDNAFTWQGRFGVMDEGSGFYYIRARYYNSITGRFISRDPIRSIGPKSINPYQYAFANPLQFIDPSGKSPNSGRFGDQDIRDLNSLSFFADLISGGLSSGEIPVEVTLITDPYYLPQNNRGTANSLTCGVCVCWESFLVGSCRHSKQRVSSSLSTLRKAAQDASKKYSETEKDVEVLKELGLNDYADVELSEAMENLEKALDALDVAQGTTSHLGLRSVTNDIQGIISLD